MSQSKRNQITKALVLTFSLVVVPAILLLLGLSHPATAETPKHYTDLTFSPAPEIKLPDYSRFQLANGMVVYLVENHELPLVSGTALIRTGDRWEPADKVGLADIMGTVMRSGGTQTRTGDEINNFLEQRAAAIETSVGETSGSASFSALSQDLESVFNLFAEILQAPAFPEAKLNQEKTQQQGAIARRNDDPNSIASREFRKLIYGAKNPYARVTEYATIAKVSRQELIDFYQQYYQPNNILLGVVGDFDSQKTRQLVEAKFGNWKPTTKSSPVQSLPKVSPAIASGIFFINQPQLTQSNIRMGHLGGQLNDPDYAALSVMNGILNGFGGRLFNEVRSRQGLAYSVSAVWRPQFDYLGIFSAGGQTRSDATVPFIKSVLAEIEKIRRSPVSAAELKYAKDVVASSFIFNFRSPAQILGRLLSYEYFNYPQDFIFQNRRKVDATTIADVQRVAAKYLKPENLVTLVVGNATQIQPPLSSLQPDGKVQAIDITIPPPQQG